MMVFISYHIIYHIISYPVGAITAAPLGGQALGSLSSVTSGPKLMTVLIQQLKGKILHQSKFGVQQTGTHTYIFIWNYDMKTWRTPSKASSSISLKRCQLNCLVNQLKWHREFEWTLGWDIHRSGAWWLSCSSQSPSDGLFVSSLFEQFILSWNLGTQYESRV